MIKLHENVRKIATGQGDDYTTSCLLDYIQFKKYCKTIAVDLSKQQLLDADPKAIQQINFQQTQMEQEMQDFVSFLKNQKKLFLNFCEERESFVNAILLNIISQKDLIFISMKMM